MSWLKSIWNFTGWPAAIVLAIVAVLAALFSGIKWVSKALWILVAVLAVHAAWSAFRKS